MNVLRRATDPSQYDLHPSGPGPGLDVGCGAKKHPGAVEIDLSADTDADVLHDFDRTPSPLEDVSFDQILLQEVIEHPDELYAVFAEVHRFGEPGARVHVRTPHYPSAFAYSIRTHKRFVSAAAVRARAESGFAHYSSCRFWVAWLRIDIWLSFRTTGIESLANRWPDVYENYFAFQLSAMNIRAELEVLK